MVHFKYRTGKVKKVSNYKATKRFLAEALTKMTSIPSGGRSIWPEDAEGYVLGPGTGTGPGVGLLKLP